MLLVLLIFWGAILASPLAFYLGTTPAFRIWAWFLPGLHLLAAVIVHRSARAAVVLLLPFTGLALWLAVVVVLHKVRL